MHALGFDFYKLLDLCNIYPMHTLNISLHVFLYCSLLSFFLAFLQFNSDLYGDAKGWAKRLYSFLLSYVPGVINPHAKIIQKWNKFFVISLLIAIFVDPLFFFVLSVLEVIISRLLTSPFTLSIYWCMKVTN